MAEVFELNSEKMQVKINGTVYEFNEPSAEMAKELEKKFKNFDTNSDADPLELYRTFFSELGLPPEALKPLSSKKILELFAFAVGAKKN